MPDLYLVIQTMGYTVGMILFGLLFVLRRKANRSTNRGRFGIVAAAAGWLWNAGSLAKYMAILGGHDSDTLLYRAPKAFAYSATAILSTTLFLLWCIGDVLMTLQSDSADGNQVFDRDLVVLEFDSVHHQAQYLLLRFKARIVERGFNVTAKLFDCRGRTDTGDRFNFGNMTQPFPVQSNIFLNVLPPYEAPR